MKLLVLFLSSIGALFAQINTVSWTVEISAGVHATGYIVVTPNRPFTAPGGHVVSNAPTTVNLDPSTGTFSVQLYANTTATPQPSFYTANFHLTGAPAYSMTWTIPTTPNPCGFSCAAGPNPAIIQLTQIDTSGAMAQYCIQYTGSTVVWAPCAGLGLLTGVIYATAGVPSAVTGSPTDCVKVNGTSGTCGGLGSLTGVIKATSGTPAVVTGSAGDCVHVDASSAPCSSGGGGPVTALGTITTAPPIAGGSGTVLTITAILGANIPCGTISGFTAGQFLTLKLTQDGTGGRTFTCAGMSNLGTVSGVAGKTDVQTFYAPTSSTLQAMGLMWCLDCNPAIIIPETTPAGAATGDGVISADSSLHRVVASNNNGSFAAVVLNNTTDTLTNKTYDTAGTGNSFKVNGNTVSAVEGNTAKVQLFSGADPATNDCPKFDASHNLVTSGAPCSGGGGGLPTKIFGGTKALSTSALSSATCRVETLAATGTLTTDNILANFNDNTDAVTGYAPTTGGILVVKAYPTADTVNFSVCNNTGSPITPGAVTANVIVMRGGFFTGTKTLSVSILTSATCRVETLSATGTLTTDTINTSFNANTDAVTGYDPATGGMLTLKVYPTADTINISVCNNTTSSITPGAVTLNAQILR